MKSVTLKAITLFAIAMLLVTNQVLAKTSITMWLSGQPNPVNRWAAEFESDFKQQNPDVDLTIELFSGIAQTREKLILAIAAGVAPDIVYDANNLMPQWMNNGVALPLDKYLNAWDGRKDLLPDLLASLKFGGKTWGVPFSAWSTGDLYNMDLLVNAGVTRPATWDEMLSAAKRLRKVGPDGKIQVTGYNVPMGSLNIYVDFEMAMQQLGSAMIDVDGTKANLKSDEARRALTYMRDIIQAGMDPNSRYSGAIEPILNDEMAIFHGFNGFTLVNVPRSDKNLEYHRSVGPVPHSSAVLGNGGILYITSTSPHPDEAWRVIESFMEPQNLKGYYLANTSVLPIRQSMFADSDILARPWSKELIASLYPPILPYGSRHPYNIDFRLIAANQFIKAIRNEIPIEEALSQAQQLVDVIVAEKAQSAVK